MAGHLSAELIAALNAAEFWRNLCADAELQPEIRPKQGGGAVTIYYRGRAVIRELKLQNGRLTGSLHHKYVPIDGAAGQYVSMSAVDGQLGFPANVGPLSLGNCDRHILRIFKKQARGARRFPEADTVQSIASNPANLILDQEVKLARGLDRERIDLCYYDRNVNKLVFVEVKRREDLRLTQPAESPEVLGQLQRYRRWIAEKRDALLDHFRRVVIDKRAIGLTPRLAGIPDGAPHDLAEKPMLVIAGCDESEVRRVLRGEGEWQALRAGLPEVAAGLIACGKGCTLGLRASQYGVVF